MACHLLEADVVPLIWGWSGKERHNTDRQNCGVNAIVWLGPCKSTSLDREPGTEAA